MLAAGTKSKQKGQVIILGCLGGYIRVDTGKHSHFFGFLADLKKSGSEIHFGAKGQHRSDRSKQF